MDGQVVLEIGYRATPNADHPEMTPLTFAASPATVGDERLWRTNPVYCVGRLLDDWSQRIRIGSSCPIGYHN